MNETKFADSGEEESLGRFAQYIDYPKEMPFPNMRFECGGPESVTRCSPSQMVFTPGSTSPLRPRNPPSRAMRRMT